MAEVRARVDCCRLDKHFANVSVLPRGEPSKEGRESEIKRRSECVFLAFFKRGISFAHDSHDPREWCFETFSFGHLLLL